MQKNLVDQQTDDNLEVQLSATGEPLSVSEIKEQLPDDAQIVQYAVLDDKILIWVVIRKRDHAPGKGASDLASLPIECSGSFGQSARYPRTMKQVQRRCEGVTQTSDCSDRVAVGKRKLVCIVPDKVLHYLPFVALISEAMSTWLKSSGFNWRRVPAFFYRA